MVQPLDGGVRWGACVPHDGGEEGVREAPHSVGGRGDRCTRKTWCQDTACLFVSFTPLEVKFVQNKCKSSLVTDVTFQTVDGSINESFNKWLTTHACVVVELADLNVTYKIPLLHVLNSNTTLNQKKHSINWLSKQTVSHSSPSANFPLRQSEATFPS